MGNNASTGNAHVTLVRTYITGCRRKWVYLTAWEKNFIKSCEVKNADFIRNGEFTKLEQIFNQCHGRGQK
jgi:hypothetical protein